MDLVVDGVPHSVTSETMASTVYMTCAGWFTHDDRVDGGVVRCVRADKCRGSGSDAGGSCDECREVGGMKSYREAVRRRIRDGPPRDKQPERPEWQWKRAVSRLEAQRDRLRAMRGNTQRVYLTEASMRGDLLEIASRLGSMSRQGLLTEKQNATLEFVANIVGNCLKKAKGRRHNETTQVLAGLLRSLCGEKAYAILANNVEGLPNEREVRKYMRYTGRAWTGRLCAEDVSRVAACYGVIMDRREIKRGSVLCASAEDETVVDPAMQWDHASDCGWGTCGDECARRCRTAPQCRRTCPDTHACVPTGDHVVDMSGRSYDEVWKGLTAARVASNVRAIVVNPLHPALPRLVLVWMPTCLTFDAKGFVLPQWLLLETLWREYLEPVVGRLAVKSSDGASTRRICMMASCYVELADTPRIMNGCLTFQFTFALDGVGRRMINLDQCFVHNGKKLLNVTASAARMAPSSRTRTGAG